MRTNMDMNMDSTLNKKSYHYPRIILLEDSPVDSALVEHILKKEGFKHQLVAISVKKEYVNALENFRPDIIISDYYLPDFDGTIALDLAREKFPYIPFIYISSILEGKETQKLKNAATDYLSKTDIEKLPKVVLRALKEAENRKLLKMARDELVIKDEFFQSFKDNLPVGFFRSTIDSPGRLIYANVALALMYGYKSTAELMKKNLADLYQNPEDRKKLLADLVANGEIKSRIVNLKNAHGDPLIISLSAYPHYDNDGNIDWMEGMAEDASDRVKYEETLRNDLAFFETLFDSISSPFFYKDKKGKYLGCNSSFAEKIIGLPKEKIINSTVFDLSEKIPPELAEKYHSQDMKLINNPGTQNYEGKVLCADGETRDFLFIKSTYKDIGGHTAGIAGIMNDITAVKKAEAEARLSNKRMNELISSMDSILIGVSTSDEIIEWNRQAESIIGFTSDEALGKKIFELDIGWKFNDVFVGISECISENRSVSITDFPLIDKNGIKKIIGMKINPITDENSSITGFLIHGKDITEKKMMESERVQTQKLRSIGELAAGIAHEINTPTQYVSDNSHFLKDAFDQIIKIIVSSDAVDEAAKSGDCAQIKDLIVQHMKLKEEMDFAYLREEIPKAIDQNLEGLGHISRIVKSMKSFSHQGMQNKAITDINKSITDTITISRNEWKYNSEVITDFEEPELFIECLPAELNQVFLNMLINSVHAVQTEINSGNIKKGKIIFSTKKTGRFVEIKISDNGCGIPKRIIERIYDPFFTTKDVGVGTGQGLAISHTIITEKHGGTINVESEPKKGTTFTIYLPIESGAKS